MTIPSELSSEIKQRIETTIPGAQVEVIQGGDRHYTLTVISNTFNGLSQVKQQQLVYSAITDLMAGDNAPIHAIDQMVLRVS
ncbi:MAG: BolA/IbaG family iron-sulfur metabolism protein [Methylococcaceae bacterium]|nr:BolA/IbaG family iron-sulfur metabolism protein [Methylococcaceae bacterium]